MRDTREITLNAGCSARYVQATFNIFYPFLKVELAAGESGSAPGTNKMLPPSDTVINPFQQLAGATIDFGKERTVAEVMKDLEQIGLSARFFRKSGNVWNAISLTQNWTLEAQNNAGEFICNEMKSILLK